MSTYRIALLPMIAVICVCGGSHKLAPELRDRPGSSTVDVIVQYASVPADRHHAKIAQRGGKLRAQLDVVRSAAYSVPSTALPDIAADPEVLHISRDHVVRPRLDYSTAAVNATVAWNVGGTGAGVTVAVVDSGVTDVPDIHGRLAYNQDFTGSDGKDKYGHGTHVAGIIAGNGHSSQCDKCTRNLSGLAPLAKLVNFRVLDQTGQGKDSSVIAAISQAITFKQKYNIRVLNLSLGRPVFESYTDDPLCQAVEAAWRAGIVVVVSAGNDGRDNSQGTEGYGTIEAPGNDPYVITVGAMKTMGTPGRADDLIASYSSKGPTMIDHIVKPDLVAPGNLVVSLLPGSATLDDKYPSTRIPAPYYNGTLVKPGTTPPNSTSYYRLNGTSMAAAVVSGVVADLLSIRPTLSPDQVKAILMQTAYKTFPAMSSATDPVSGVTYDSQYDIFTVGAGYVDLAAAIAASDPPVGSAVSPTARFDPVTGYVYLDTDGVSIWDDRSVWGVLSVWGAYGVDDNRSVWGQGSVWGQAGTDAFNLVWGGRSVWGQLDGSLDAESILSFGEN